MADAICPDIDAKPTSTGGRNDAASNAGTVSSANEPMPDGILMKPPMTQSAANSAVSVIVLSFMSVFFLFVRSEHFCATDVFVIRNTKSRIDDTRSDEEVV